MPDDTGVELHAAWFFDCPGCGREVFIRPHPVTEGQRLGYGTEGALLVSVPAQVECPYCSSFWYSYLEDSECGD